MRIIICIDGKCLMLPSEAKADDVIAALMIDKALVVAKENQYRDNTKWEIVGDGICPSVRIVSDESIKDIQTDEEKQRERLNNLIEENREMRKEVRDLTDKLKQAKGG